MASKGRKRERKRSGWKLVPYTNSSWLLWFEGENSFYKTNSVFDELKVIELLKMNLSCVFWCYDGGMILFTMSSHLIMVWLREFLSIDGRFY
jgi:hypothetical protein